MRGLEKTVVVLAFLALISQTIRHAYMLWFEPRGSVLDKFDKPVKKDIAAATSLDELARRYEVVRKQADEAKQGRPNTEPPPTYAEKQEMEPFLSENELRMAIQDWERKAEEIHEIRFYWTIGLVLLVLGVVIYKRLNPWVGLTLIIAALCEFIYWCSPTFFGGTREFDRLLWNKLILSLVSLVLLLVVIWMIRVFEEKPVISG
ncbi:MAG TPA: hypothetical protein VI636_12750 [Candidatus Angelobacter sp.]